MPCKPHILEFIKAFFSSWSAWKSPRLAWTKTSESYYVTSKLHNLALVYQKYWDFAKKDNFLVCAKRKLASAQTLKWIYISKRETCEKGYIT